MKVPHIVWTTTEWINCLANPRRAKKTWLRIEKKHERIATIIGVAIVAFLWYLYVGTNFVIGQP